ncbi:MAG TPA: hypothetical protein VL793_00325, partial [Patescibacteria group bacterium]|nr:hypothetical protein [Patescibacteria group bacterium]
MCRLVTIQSFLSFLLLPLVFFGHAELARAQTLPNGGKAIYTLINGSTLTDECIICGRPTIPVPIRGTFELRLLSQGPFFLNYAVENISFAGGQFGGSAYTVSGHGTFRIGGELAVQQDLELELTIDNGITNKICEFTNTMPMTSRLWPMLQMGATQTNGTLVQQYSLILDAAPFRQI